MRYTGQLPELGSAERRAHEDLRVNLCRKYSEQFWREHNAGKLPNLALIINDAIGEAIEQHLKVTA